MNEHSFCIVWNVPDVSLIINAVMCKVIMLCIRMHINTHLYVLRNMSTYCYILFANPQHNTPFKILLKPKYSLANQSIHVYLTMHPHLNGKYRYASIYRCLTLKPRIGRLFCSSEVHGYKVLYLSHQTTDSDEWTFFLPHLKCTRLFIYV